MKARVVSLFLGIALVVPVSARAQGPWGYFRIPDLTTEQKSRMDVLWVAFVRDTLQRQAALEQAMVDLKVQVSADKPDAAAIQQAVERIAALKGQMLEAEVRLVLEVKKVLKPEQLRWFNLDLLSRSRYSDKFADPDAPIGGGPWPGGLSGGPGVPSQGPGGPGQGPGGPPPSVFGPAGPGGFGGPGGWCGPRERDEDEPPPPPAKAKPGR